MLSLYYGCHTMILFCLNITDYCDKNKNNVNFLNFFRKKSVKCKYTLTRWYLGVKSMKNYHRRHCEFKSKTRSKEASVTSFEYFNKKVDRFYIKLFIFTDRLTNSFYFYFLFDTQLNLYIQ